MAAFTHSFFYFNKLVVTQRQKNISTHCTPPPNIIDWARMISSGFRGHYHPRTHFSGGGRSKVYLTVTSVKTDFEFCWKGLVVADPAWGSSGPCRRLEKWVPTWCFSGSSLSLRSLTSSWTHWGQLFCHLEHPPFTPTTGGSPPPPGNFSWKYTSSRKSSLISRVNYSLLYILLQHLSYCKRYSSSRSSSQACFLLNLRFFEPT